VPKRQSPQLSKYALNAVCPYYTMYPLDFPLRVLKEHGKAGDWVIDPFCGRGTTNFAARLLAMPSLGVDSSPVAVALAQAKLATASPEQVLAAARAILSHTEPPRAVPSGPFWTLAFHETTLTELCRLREALLADCASPPRVLLRAIILGALHGPRPKGKPSYFSNQSPRTFAPKPNYAVRYWTDHSMKPPEVSVMSVLAARADRCLASPPPTVEGMVRLGDSRLHTTYSGMPKAQFVVTSPPYFGMRTYLPDQWLRLWFLGGPDYVEYRQPQGQLEHTGAAHFSAEMTRVWRNMALQTTPSARLIIRFGGIHDREAEPMDVLKTSLLDSGWRIVTAKAVADSDTGRRQVRQFQAQPKKPRTEYDVYCHHA